MLINCVLFCGAVDDQGIPQLSSEEMEILENKSNRNRLFLNSPFLRLVADLSGEAERVLGMRLQRLTGVTHMQVWDYVASGLQANSLKAAKMPNTSLIVYFMQQICCDIISSSCNVTGWHRALTALVVLFADRIQV